ncbi:hypothetical protein [Nitrosomonas oligotropha]|uniref:hypothetical protein n=1 Tax=Nitrosomonas oligotropha TaxID=42354 RepID=UPI001370E478|nr:hypothetical protein [Nitrosomonas oligotropha]
MYEVTNAQTNPPNPAHPEVKPEREKPEIPNNPALEPEIPSKTFIPEKIPPLTESELDIPRE